jgi:hypothetical protein
VGTANNVLIGLGIFVILLVVYFQGSKKKSMPSKLNMRAGSSSAPVQAAQVVSPELSSLPLNVMFNYNGHTFDAYETLGIPAGSSWDEVRAAFDKNISQADNTSHEFYLTAFNAIKTVQKF